jgi:hypothetical protein
VIVKYDDNKKYHVVLNATGLTIVGFDEQNLKEFKPDIRKAPPLPPKPTNLQPRNRRESNGAILATCKCEERCPQYPTCSRESAGLQILSSHGRRKTAHW